MGDRRLSALLLEVAIDADGVDAPWVSSVSSDGGLAGDTFTVSGLGFEPSQGSGAVKINGEACTIVSWTNDQIVCTVPVGATTGDLVVTNNSGNASAGELFTVDEPETATLTDYKIVEVPVKFISLGNSRVTS
jgi:hypothetical protein